jgi:hypothetical protein
VEITLKREAREGGRVRRLRWYLWDRWLLHLCSAAVDVVVRVPERRRLAYRAAGLAAAQIMDIVLTINLRHGRVRDLQRIHDAVRDNTDVGTLGGSVNALLDAVMPGLQEKADFVLARDSKAWRP